MKEIVFRSKDCIFIPENNIIPSERIAVNISKIVKSSILFSLDIIFIILISLSYYVTLKVNTLQVIEIPKGSTKGIISYLNKNGYDMHNLDYYFVRLIGYPQSGWIDLKATTMTRGDFYHKLTTSKAALKQVTLIPGETYVYFLESIAQNFNLSYEELLKYYDQYKYKLDGNILAETYSLPIGMDEERMILYLINYTQKQYKEFSQKIFGDYDKKSWYNYIIIASIIEQEAANTQEMPIVSSVIHNRLKKGMPLQMDGTLNYGKYSREKITPYRIQNDTSRYNTYKYAGLPDDPICSVSLNSIKAAIFPAKTDYLYFMRNKQTGTHDFTNSYNSHLKNVDKAKVTPKSDTKSDTIKQLFEKI